MSEPSPILVSLAVSHWNPVLSSVILGVLGAILLTRAMLIRQALFDWAVLVAAGLWLLVVVLREGYVQDFLASTVGLNLAGTRFLAHSAAVLSGAVELILVCAWRSTEKITGKRLWKILSLCLTPALVCLCVMLLLSWPALISNRAVEEWPTREALYALVYAIVPIVGAAAVGIEGARAAFGRSGGIVVRAVGVLIVTAVSASIFDHCYRAWTGLMILRRPGTLEIVLDRADATDMMLIPVVAIVFFSVVPMMIFDLARRIRQDADSRNIDTLHDFWAYLVTTFPNVRLNRAVLDRPSEKLHRMLIECEDALLLLSAWMTDAERRAETAADRAAAVEAATERTVGQPLGEQEVLAWASDEQSMYAVARRVSRSWEMMYSP